MISALILVVAGQSSVFTQTIDRAAKAIDAMKSGSVHLNFETSLDKKMSKTSASISFQRPEVLFVRLKEPIQSDFDATDRSYLLQGNSLVAFDHRWNEVLRRKNLPKGTLSERAEYAIGNLGEPFSCVFSGIGLKNTLSRFAKMGDWSLKRERTGSSLSAFNRQSKARLLLTFDSAGRLTRVALNQIDSYSNWTYSYASSGSNKLLIPNGAKSVTQFIARPAPPKFEDSSAKQIFQESVRTYDRLRSYQLRIEGTAGNSRLWVSGRNLRGEDQTKTWSYRSRNCAIIDRSTNRFYTGTVSSADLIDALGNLKLSVASWPRWALLNNNPLQNMFNSSFTIRSSGNLKVEGIDSQILQVSSPRWSGSIQIDVKTKLLVSLTVKTIDSTGRIISVSNQVLKYSGVGAAIPTSVFQLGPPKGAKIATIRSLIKRK